MRKNLLNPVKYSLQPLRSRSMVSASAAAMPIPNMTTSMKNPLILRNLTRPAAAGFCLAAAAAATLLVGQSAQAASSNWNVDAAGNWSLNTNWAGSVIPGATSGTTSTDVATFDKTLTAQRTVTVDANRNIGGITFNNAGAFRYLLSGGSLLLSNGGVIQTASGNAAQVDTISSAISIQGVNGAGTFTSGATLSTSLLSIGAVTGVSTAGNTTTLTLNGSNTGSNLVTGVIGDGGAGGKLAVVKSDAGKWVLSGANTYTGATTINAGSLQLGNGSTTGTLSTGSTITVNGGVFTINRTNAVVQGTDFTATGISGAGGLTQAGSGTTTLTSANSYTGTTSVTAGTLALSGAGTLGGTTASLSVSGVSTILDLGGTSQTVGAVTLTGAASATPSTIQNGSIATNGGYTVTSGNNSTAVISANLSGNSALSFTGGATSSFLLLSGTNSYTGGTNLNAGILAVGSDNALGSGTLTLNTTNVTSGLQSSGGSHTISNAVTAAGSQVNVLISSGSNDLTFSGLITNTQAAGRTYTVNNSGLTTFSGGLVLSSVALSSAIHIFTGSGNLTINSTISDGLNSGGKIQYKGSGLLILSGANTFGGTVEATGGAGTISLRNDLALGAAGGGNNSVGAGTTFEFQNNISIVGETVLVSGVGVGGNGALRNISGNNSFTGLVALSADSTIKSESGSLSLSAASSITLGGTALTLDGAGDINVAGAITSASGGPGTLIKTGTGTATFSAASTYTGATTVNAGTLVISSTGSISNTSAVTVAAGAKLAYNSSTARTGTVTLNGVDASNRATLGGTGTINAALTLNNIGDTLSPGNSPGIQNFATGQTWNSFTYLWETNNFTGTTAGTDFDRITITGSLNLTGGSGAYGLDLHSLTAGNLAGNVPNFSEVNTSWTILTTTTGITGFNAANWTIATGSFTSSPAWIGTFSISQSGNDLVLSYAVPEPSTWALLAFSLTTVMVLRRRRS